jgi:predicted DNA-binding ribbon-helix-helix protein
MLRTTIFLTQTQCKTLAAVAEPDGITVAALIRILINEGLKRRQRQVASAK